MADRGGHAAVMTTAPQTRQPDVRDEATSAKPSRRALLAAGALGALSAAGVVRPASAGEPRPLGASADIDPNALLVRLINRTTFGFTSAELARAKALGYWGYIDEQLALTEADETQDLRDRLALYTTLTLTGDQAYTLNNHTLQRTELVESTILRALRSRRQLYERLVEFWSDHFNVDVNVNHAAYIKTVDDREVTRRYALATFPQLLLATMQSPSMLSYLGNDQNTALGPNENLARELLELHTMGVGTGYTQADVRAVARALTGWTLWTPTATSDPALRGTFRYNDAVHDKGEKVFMGHVLPANRGIEDGLDVLNILAAHPSTAARIARKLCHRFIGEACPQAHVDAVARVYTSTQGDIKSMVRAVLRPEALWDARPKFKRPFHFLVSALRPLPHTLVSLANARGWLINAGHQPFHWNPPDGYPDSTEYWRGNLLARWNFGMTVAPGTASTIQVNTAGFFANCSSGYEVAHWFDTEAMGWSMRMEEKQRIAAFMGNGNPNTTMRQESLWLCMAAPSFQWY